MAVNQVIVGDEVKLDLTGDTVSENNLLAGVTAHNAAGEPITGALGVATPESDGLMSAADKVKLDGIGGSISPTEKPVKMVSGFYTGDGTTNRIIDIGITPTVLFLRSVASTYQAPNYIVLPNSPIYPYADELNNELYTIVDNGFKMINDYYNRKGSRQNYVAFVQID